MILACKLISVMLESGRMSGRMYSGSSIDAFEFRLRVCVMVVLRVGVDWAVVEWVARVVRPFCTVCLICCCWLLTTVEVPRWFEVTMVGEVRGLRICKTSFVSKCKKIQSSLSILLLHYQDYIKYQDVQQNQQ